MSNNYNLKKAIFFMLVSSFSFAVMQIFVKLTSGKFHVMEQVFFRNFIITVICGIYIAINRSSFLGNRENRKLLCARSLFGYMGVIANFYAINNMVVADAAIIQRTSPIFVVLIACFIFREKFTIEKALTLTFAFIGAMFVVRPQFDSRLLPSLVGMFSALSASCAYICVSKLGNNERTETIIFVFSFISTILSLPFMIYYFEMPELKMLMYLILIGIFSALGQVGLTVSYQFAPASDVSIFNYSGILFVVILGYFTLGESINIYSLIGILLIFSVSFVSYMVKISTKNERKTPKVG